MLPADFPLKTIQVSAIEVFLSLIKWAVMFRILPDRFRFIPLRRFLPIPVHTGSGSYGLRFLVPVPVQGFPVILLSSSFPFFFACIVFAFCLIRACPPHLMPVVLFGCFFRPILLAGGRKGLGATSSLSDV